MPLVLINDDPPRHTRFRRLVNKAFTPRRIAGCEPWIEAIANELLDEIGGSESDVVRGYTMPLPVKTIATLLGIPRERYETFKQWTDTVLGTDESATGDGRMGAAIEMMQLFGGIAAERRNQPANDLVTALVEAEFDGEHLQEWEILGFCILLLIAGNETTTNLMGNMLNMLAQRPDVWEQLKSDRSLVEPVIEETLRWESPVQMLFRKATRDVEVSGVHVPAGAQVAMCYGAANRDPSQWPEPDELRLDRNLRDHVAFGHGVHFCLGSPLARAEARITLNACLDRFSRIEPGSKTGKRQTGAQIVYGFKQLPLRLVK
jgi:hypothetical protein